MSAAGVLLFGPPTTASPAGEIVSVNPGDVKGECTIHSVSVDTGFSLTCTDALGHPADYSSGRGGSPGQNCNFVASPATFNASFAGDGTFSGLVEFTGTGTPGGIVSCTFQGDQKPCD